MAKVPRSLAGRVVAITGGARGIGRATAAALIAQGARVAIGDIDVSLAEATAEQLGSGTVGLPLDVTEIGSFEAFIDEVERRLGPLDVLINNAGIMPVGPFVEESDGITRRMIDINLLGVINGSKLALKRFEARGRGHLVQISSMLGKVGTADGATYCATKYAVVGLSDSLKLELRGTNIDISVVMPVGTNTELYSGLPPIRGIKTPEAEDVANAIVEALQTARYEVYVPRAMKAIYRFGTLVPRPMMESLARILGGDRVLASPDSGARAAYDARIAKSVASPQAPATEREQEPVS
jgi:NAD(P)-dependent dehydrogenase (short-subunit alcohol dehydrogenase family)